MSEMNRRRPDDEPGNDPEQQAPAQGVTPEPAGPPFDWQVLLLRYLPQPAGSTHVIKRLAPR
jgi:hypothetical protein